MTVAIQTKSVQEIFEEMTESYSLGEYLDGHTNYGEDALMSARQVRGQVPTHLFWIWIQGGRDHTTEA